MWLLMHPPRKTAADNRSTLRGIASSLPGSSKVSIGSIRGSQSSWMVRREKNQPASQRLKPQCSNRGYGATKVAPFQCNDLVIVVLDTPTSNLLILLHKVPLNPLLADYSFLSHNAQICFNRIRISRNGQPFTG